ncbi:peroxynitrite isomerase THAP4-like [Dermacentor albipictus]|uniref:peroxynitrite isomerase THAP4-like n=1 Tax=Dermacentor albipictus TaxID=60249 RepID=UPI0031FD5F6D
MDTLLSTSSSEQPCKRKSKEHCSVPYCTSTRWKSHELSFHRFPKVNEAKRRQLWIQKLRMGKPVTPTMVVCSRHFQPDDYFFPGIYCARRVLKKTAVPSRNLPQSSTFDASKAARCQQRDEERLRRRQHRSKKAISGAGSSTSGTPVSPNERYTKPDTLEETPREYLKCKSEELVVNVYTGNEEEVAEILANMNSTQRSY